MNILVWDRFGDIPTAQKNLTGNLPTFSCSQTWTKLRQRKLLSNHCMLCLELPILQNKRAPNATAKVHNKLQTATFLSTVVCPHALRYLMCITTCDQFSSSTVAQKFLEEISAEFMTSPCILCFRLGLKNRVTVRTGGWTIMSVIHWRNTAVLPPLVFSIFSILLPYLSFIFLFT